MAGDSSDGKRKKNRKKKRIVIPLLAVCFVAAAAFLYVNDYYHSEEAVRSYLQSDDNVVVTKIQEGLYLDGPGEQEALIFYPGAKVEYTAYLPLLYELAENGVDCFLIKMPCNLAFLGQNKAEKITGSYEYEHWYLAGHSLGGAMAASYVSGHPETFDGLALLAAYPTKKLAADDFFVVSIYGSQDGILNMEKVKSGRELVTSDYTEVCIEGGNHAGFGNYGIQKGDKEASVSRKEQQRQTVDAILQMTEAHKNRTSEETAMTYEQITQQEAKKIMETESEIVILDVRTREEYDSGHIKGAICIPNEEIMDEPKELSDKMQTILVYCRSGRRSKQAAQKLADMGYEHVLEFGGILEWPYPEMTESVDGGGTEDEVFKDIYIGSDGRNMHRNRGDCLSFPG